MTEQQNEVTESRKKLRNGITVVSLQEDAIKKLAVELQEKLQTVFIMVVDTAGQAIYASEPLIESKSNALGSLLAATFRPARSWPGSPGNMI